MKIAVNTFYTHSYQPLANIVVPNLKDYCYRHNYDLHITTVPDGNFHYVKTIDTRKLLDEYDLVFTMENDILVTNHNIKPTDFIDDEHDMFLTRDINDNNSGIFITKSSEWSKGWLDFVQSFKGEDGYGDEQNVWERHHHEKIKYVPHPSFNSYPYIEYAPSYGYINWEQYNPRKEIPTHDMGNWEKGDFILHLPGMTLEKRIELFDKYKEHIVL